MSTLFGTPQYVVSFRERTCRVKWFLCDSQSQSARKTDAQKFTRREAHRAAEDAKPKSVGYVFSVEAA